MPAAPVIEKDEVTVNEDLPDNDVVNLPFARKHILGTFNIDIDAATLPKRLPFVTASPTLEEDEA